MTDLPTIAGYRIDSELGRGAMGIVYGGVQLASGQEVAIKIPHAHLTSPEAAERFRREARVMAALDHPRTIHLLDADLQGQRPYLVMNRMPGRTLQDELKEQGHLPVVKAVQHAIAICEGLTAAHDLGILHRDVKPTNCYLDANGEVCVGDFGLSHERDSDLGLTHSGDVLGTPLFMSPEQARGDEVDERSDVYSVCAMLHCLVAGTAPITANTNAQLLSRIQTQPPRRLRLDRPDAPAALERVLIRGLAKDPAERFGDMRELRAALSRIPARRSGPSVLLLRLAAIALDGLIYVLVFDPITVGALPDLPGWLHMGATLLAYTTATTALLGHTFGQRVFQLEVLDVHTRLRPRLWRALLRSAAFLAPTVFLVFTVPSLAMQWSFLGWTLLTLAGPFLAIPLLASTMRRKNGYRGLHELLSRTAVEAAATPPPAPRRAVMPGIPARGLEIGDYVTATARVDAPACLAFDKGLRRWVLLQSTALRPANAENRRRLDRRTRCRWVAEAHDAHGDWDVCLLPRCAPLQDALPRLSGDWARGRVLLDSLVRELVTAQADGTLPPTLSTGQVAVLADGDALLLDATPADWATPPQAGTGEPPADRWDFVRQVAATVFPERTQLPMHARSLLSQIDAGTGQEREWQGLQAAFAATSQLPPALSGRLRSAQVCLRGVWLALLVLCVLMSHYVADLMRYETLQVLEASLQHAIAEMPADSGLRPAAEADRRQVTQLLASWYDGIYGLTSPAAPAAPREHTTLFGLGECDTVAELREQQQLHLAFSGARIREAIFTPLEQALLILLAIAWTFGFRSGLSCRLLGTEVVDANGQPASRAACLLRTAILATPALALAFAAYYAQGWTAREVGLSHHLQVAAQLTLMVTLLLGLISRRRMPHEILSRTWLVPR